MENTELDFTHDKTLLVCECGNVEHQLIFSHDQDEKAVYTMIHLTKLSFWRRVKYGLRYIFGYQCKYGAFEETMLSIGHIPALQKVMDTIKGVHEQNMKDTEARFANCGLD